MKIDAAAMLNILPKALEGWLGVIAVIAVIMLAVYLLSRVFRQKDE